MPETTVVRIGALVYPPYVNDCVGSWPRNCSDPGLDFLLITELLQAIGYSAVEVVESGNISSLLWNLDNGLADVSASTWFMQRLHAWPNLEATPVVLEDTVVFLVKKQPAKRLSNNLLFSNCDWKVWAIFLGLLIAVIICKKVARNWMSRCEISVKSMETAWFLVFGMTLGTYANFLAISLNQPPPPNQPFISARELSEKLLSGEHRLVTPYPSLLSSMNSMIHDPVTRKNLELAQAKNPPKQVVEPQEVLVEVLSDDHFVGFIWRSHARRIVSHHCDFHFISLSDISEKPAVYTYHLDAEFGAALNAEMLRGDFTRYYRSRSDRHLKPGENESQSTVSCQMTELDVSKKPLRLGQVLDVFWLLLTGFVMAWFTVFVEKFSDSEGDSIFRHSEAFGLQPVHVAAAGELHLPAAIQDAGSASQSEVGQQSSAASDRGSWPVCQEQQVAITTQL